MPSTVYKGDLAEVSFAPETGLKIRIGVDPDHDASMVIATLDDITILAFKAEINTTLFQEAITFTDATCDTNHTSGLSDGSTTSTKHITMDSTALVRVGMVVTGTGVGTNAIVTKINSATAISVSVASTATNSDQTLTFSATNLKYPKNMLVGSQLVFTASGGANADDIDTEDLADTGNGGRVFTIVENNGCSIKITPAMITPDIPVVGPDNVLQILPYKTPPMDVGMSAGAATESVHTDQFLGITSALTLPETKVDLKRFHVVGLGRDVSVQVPGKLTNEGGSFEVAMHSARWLKYCLGHELILSPNGGSVATTLSSATLAGDCQIVVASKSNIEVNDYIEIRDAAPIVPVVSDHEPDGGTWDGTLTDFEFDNAEPHEARRVIGVSENDNTVYLDEPLLYPHAASTDVEVRHPDTAGSLPVIVSSTGTITNPVTHLLFSRSTQPSFSLEVSQRRRDMDSDETTVDGGVGDTKELSRVFRGCKVTDFTMTTDNDAALRLAVNFNAALCYTDTGRLEGTPITRYASHRMFDDTAATEQGRINSGIAKGTQKPFMFYNGSIKLAGQQVAQVLNFSLTGQTGMQSFHTINGHHQAASAYGDQVPFAGARNATLMVEGQTSYEMTMEIAVDDPIFYHKMRSGVEFSVNSEDSTAVGFPRNQIRIEFEKNLTGSTAAGASEKMIVLIDDYYIVEAPLQIPEDKGLIKSTLKIMPKAIKVLARDAIGKY
jgi:hypothetical protein